MSIILKRGTEANRSGLSLKTGEPIFTTDTRRLYIGSGSSSAGNEIEFGQLSASFVSASTISATNVTVDTLTAKNPINTTCSYSQTASYLLGSVESASYVDYANVGNKPSLVSSSAQIDYAGIQNKPTTIATASYVAFANVANKPSLVSSSLQFDNADNVTFGQITASRMTINTLVVQTITSSAEYVTGSTIHGSTLANTHQFTGSVNVTGSMSVIGGNVGIGTTAPETKLHVAAPGGTTGTYIARFAGGDTWHNAIQIANSSSREWALMVNGPARFPAGALSLFDKTAGADRLIVTAGGEVGIGTTSPNERFTVGGSGTFGVGFQQDSTTIVAIKPNTITGEVQHFATTNYFPTFYSNNVERMRIDANGNVGIGTTSPTEKLDVAGAIVTRGAQLSYATEANAGLIDFNGGNARFLSFGSSSHRGGFSFYAAKQNNVEGFLPFTIYGNGVIKFGVYGAGTLVTDSSGNITATSDGRMKDVSGSFDRGLDAIINLYPKVYHWKEESGLNVDDVNVGLIAQEVLPYIPEAVACKDDRYTMSDRPIIAALINAVKELKADNDQLRARIEALEA